jgi:hypothetical protein
LNLVVEDFLGEAGVGGGQVVNLAAYHSVQRQLSGFAYPR